MDELLKGEVTPESVRAAVASIAEVAGDDEVAHSRTDEMYIALVLAIAEGRCTDPPLCCSFALAVEEIDFERWCA